MKLEGRKVNNKQKSPQGLKSTQLVIVEKRAGNTWRVVLPPIAKVSFVCRSKQQAECSISSSMHINGWVFPIQDSGPVLPI